MENQEQSEHSDYKRGYFYSILTVALMVYAVTVAVALVIGFFYADRLVEMLQSVDGYEKYSQNYLLTGITVGFLLHIGSFAGLILLWKFKRWGFFIFSFSIICASILPVFFGMDPSLSGVLFLAVVSFYAFSFKKFS